MSYGARNPPQKICTFVLGKRNHHTDSCTTSSIAVVNVVNVDPNNMSIEYKYGREKSLKLLSYYC